MEGAPFKADSTYCPTCEDFVASEQIEFLGLIPDLGNIPRYRCMKCGNMFEALPPDPLPGARPDPD